MLLSTSTLFVQPRVSHAAYGSSASIELPSVLDYLIERDEATKIDKNSESILYQGADRKVLLQRLQVAAQRISEIPSIAQQNKWSQINGILTGPLGELIVTMRQVMAGSSGGGTNNEKQQKQLQSAMKLVQADLYQIGAAANKKSYDGCYDGTGKKKEKVVLNYKFHDIRVKHYKNFQSFFLGYYFVFCFVLFVGEKDQFSVMLVSHAYHLTFSFHCCFFSCVCIANQHPPLVGVLKKTNSESIKRFRIVCEDCILIILSNENESKKER